MSDWFKKNTVLIIDDHLFCLSFFFISSTCKKKHYNFILVDMVIHFCLCLLLLLNWILTVVKSPQYTSNLLVWFDWSVFHSQHLASQGGAEACVMCAGVEGGYNGQNKLWIICLFFVWQNKKTKTNKWLRVIEQISLLFLPGWWQGDHTDIVAWNTTQGRKRPDTCLIQDGWWNYEGEVRSWDWRDNSCTVYGIFNLLWHVALQQTALSHLQIQIFIAVWVCWQNCGAANYFDASWSSCMLHVTAKWESERGSYSK